MNLTQKQFNWLLKLASNDVEDYFANIPWDLRKKAYELLQSVGYLREYNYEERTSLLELRNDYIRWKQTVEVEDDLPF